MAKQIKFDTSCSKTYKTEANAAKAFEDRFGDCDVRYIICKNDEGRFFPVGIGEKAANEGVHFHFHVVN